MSGTVTVAAAYSAASVRGDGDVWLDAEVIINRADFGLAWNLMGVASMNNTLTIHATFIRRCRTRVAGTGATGLTGSTVAACRALVAMKSLRSAVTTAAAAPQGSGTRLGEDRQPCRHRNTEREETHERPSGHC